MRNWCARHPIYFMGLYALFYLTFFALLERTIQTPDLWVHCRLDDLIPFCKYAIIPYSQGQAVGYDSVKQERHRHAGKQRQA